MAFDLNNYNIQPGSDSAVVAQALDSVFEALADGPDLLDVGPVFAGVTTVVATLQGRPLAEIKAIVARAALAVLLDELTESGVV
mgnify:FL=1